MTMVTDYIYGKDNGTNDGGYWRLNRIFPTPGGLLKFLQVMIFMLMQIYIL